MSSSSDHSKKMRALFGGVDPAKLALQDGPAAPKVPDTRRVSSGTVKSMTGAFSAIEQENEDLRRKLEHADVVVELDPSLLDPSPFRDRFESDAEAAEELQDLKASLKTEGQKIAVLVRPHPNEPGRYQLAYGHRRTAALKELRAEAENPETIRVRAYVRELTDADLVREQSLENAVRENLTWIEMAMWASQLRAAGINNRDMAPILGKHESEISRLLVVAGKIPVDIARGIGRAKRSGRGNWTALADALIDDKAEKRVRSILADPDFEKAESDQRLVMATAAAKGAKKKKVVTKFKSVDVESNGQVVAKVKRSSTGTTMAISGENDGFASWLTEKLGELHDEYLKTRKND
ncbi:MULTISPECIES: plasmid partitioning protein RepB [unclassified Pannonibacter]|uniref:plasmid partitioning protein RepB n=1 Tax=unclassified Pannonibacter TaxID=2627228 RepID=UPI001648367F|nr:MULTISPECIES: plasmid partitioning protein RepB [unclassified Pannonibacter]